MKLKYDFLIQEVAGAYMAVAVGKGSEKFKDMVKMNSTAKRVFELVQQGMTEDAIVETMLQEYDAEVGDIRKSVNEMVSLLKRKNLIAE